MPFPLLPIAAGGVLLLLLTQKSKDNAQKSPYPTAPTDGSKPPAKEPPPPSKTWAEMSPALQEQVAAALGALGVSPATGEIEGTPTADGIKLATQTAALCESQGFYDVAAELNRLVGIAAKKVPTPPSAEPIKQAAPAGLTPAEVEAIARTLTLDRDPKSIAALIEKLSKLPQSPQRDHLVQMAQALLLQLATAQSTTQTMHQIEQVIKAVDPAAVAAATAALPPAIVPVASSSSPPITVSPGPTTSTGPTKAQIDKLLGSRVLQSGMSGSDVKAWQQWLRRDGFPSVADDGKFGPATAAATKAWQSAHGVTPDGKVGPNTKGRIGTPAVLSSGATKSTAAVPSAAAATASRLLSRGSQGTDVKAWQTQLRADGFAVDADGIFGAGTEAATKAWQSQRGLSPDGKVGPGTRAKIGTKPSTAAPVVTSSPKPTAAAAPSRQVPVKASDLPSGRLSLDQFPDPNPSAPLIKRGSPKSDYVVSFQKALNAFGYPVGTPDGIFGAGTEKQTRAFQAWARGYYGDGRIVADGIVGPIGRRLVRMRAAELLRDSGKAA